MEAGEWDGHCWCCEAVPQLSYYIAMSEKGSEKGLSSCFFSLEKQSALLVPYLQPSLSLSLFLTFPKKNVYALAVTTMRNFCGHEVKCQEHRS